MSQNPAVKAAAFLSNQTQYEKGKTLAKSYPFQNRGRSLKSCYGLYNVLLIGC